VNERTNRTLFLLTVVTVIALPMTIIPGLFGMNVGGIPLQHWEGSFWLLAFLVVGLAAVCGVLAFRGGVVSLLKTPSDD